MGYVNPNEIEDDGDDGLEPARHARDARTRGGAGVPGGAAAGLMLGGALGAMGGASRNTSGNYAPVQNPSNTAYDGAGSTKPEQSEWLASQTTKRRKMRWLIVSLIVLAVLLIIGGVVAGVLVSQKNKQNAAPPPPPQSAAQDDSTLLDANSAEIKALQKNADLHRVFPGMAYTPLGAQYPDCLTNPPSQNNVTRDVAVISQLTDTIRLYGTDCNQTEMVLAALDKLAVKDMKIWLAVWLNGNATTNARGLRAMYDIIDKYHAAPFKGVILGNEVLYRKDLTLLQLSDIIDQTRANLTQRSITSLPIAVADLGDNWTADLASRVDVVMSNVHPFFGGLPANQGAGWAWDFWQGHDVVLTKGNATKQNVISEIGWPSQGGNDCGASNCTSSTQGAIAGIDEMNTFMSDWVCGSLKNGTEYFW